MCLSVCQEESNEQAYGNVTGYTLVPGNITVGKQLQVTACVPSSATRFSLYTVNQVGTGVLASHILIPEIQHGRLAYCHQT